MYIVISLLILGAIRTLAVSGLGEVRPESPQASSSSQQVVSLASTLLTRRGLVISTGGGFDSLQAGYPSVLREAGGFKMWYFGCDPSYFCQIGYATSGDGRSWTKQGVVLTPSLPQEGGLIAYPEVRKIGDGYRMWYNGFDGSRYRIFYAESPDGLSWTKHGVVLDAGPPGSPDAAGVTFPRVAFDGTYHMSYTSASRSPSEILIATSADGVAWTKNGVSLSAGSPNALDSNGVQAGAVSLVGGSYAMVYTGLSNTSTARLFYAISVDGTIWERLGLALDVLPSSENLVAHASFVVQPNGAVSVYYVARAGFADLQIYLADGPSPFLSPGGGIDILWTLVVPLIALAVGVGVLSGVALVYLMTRTSPRTRLR